MLFPPPMQRPEIGSRLSAPAMTDRGACSLVSVLFDSAETSTFIQEINKL